MVYVTLRALQAAQIMEKSVRPRGTEGHSDP